MSLTVLKFGSNLKSIHTAQHSQVFKDTECETSHFVVDLTVHNFELYRTR